jgi:hypothetical protein
MADRQANLTGETGKSERTFASVGTETHELTENANGDTIIVHRDTGTVVGVFTDAGLETSSTDTGELSVNGQNALIVDRADLQEQFSVSSTSTGYTETDDLGGAITPDDLALGEMIPYIKFTGYLSIGDASATASAVLRYFNATDGNGFVGATEVTTPNTTRTPFDTGWLNLRDELATTSEPTAFRAAIKTSDGSFATTLESPSAVIAIGP